MQDAASRRDPQTYAIIGAAQEVHRYLGGGFLEAVYQEALSMEFHERHVPFAREVDVPIRYKERLLAFVYRADFVCDGEVLVEVKAIRALSGVEDAQIINYLKATGVRRGLLLNFGGASLQHKRFVK